MDTTIFARLWAFTKIAFTKYIRQTLTGAGLVGYSMWHVFFNHIPIELVHTWIGIWAGIKTVISAYLGSMATALGTHHVEIIKQKRNEKRSQKKGRRDRAA